MYRKKNSNAGTHASNRRDKTKIRNKLFVWCIVLVVMAAIAVADVAQEPTEAYALANTGAAGIETSDSEPSVSASGKLNFIGFDREKCKSIRDALRVLSALYKTNIVPSSNVDGPLTVTSLYDVTFEQALDAVLGYGYKYDIEGNFIKVYTAEEYKKIKEDPDRMIYKVFTLYYISAAEAQNLITPVLSSDVQIQVSSPAETEISGGGGTSSGGSSSSAAGSIGSGGGGDSMALHDTIVVYDYPEKIEKAKEVIKALDIRPKQVLVEATILSALLTEKMDIGIDLNLLDGVSLTSSLTQIASLGSGTPIETSGFAIAGDGLKVGIRSGNLVGFIRALEEVTDITVLANPKILALNKQEGSVLIGRNLGYRQTSSISAAGTEVQGEVKFLPTGTQLVFRPYIGNDGYIRMDIYPKDSTAELDSDGVPQETTTELKTNILVKDGETIVIGGLFRDVVTTVRTQVPLLGDIPIIGALFRGTTDTTQREEVIVLLTTHIIEEPSELEGEARADDIRRKRFGAKEGLQWAGKARLAEDRYAKAAQYYVDGDTEAAMKELDYVLELRPSYLEAIRLKEKIIAETNPDELDNIERILLGDIEREDSDKWQRR